jgi:hypothetical protein
VIRDDFFPSILCEGSNIMIKETNLIVPILNEAQTFMRNSSKKCIRENEYNALIKSHPKIKNILLNELSILDNEYNLDFHRAVDPKLDLIKKHSDQVEANAIVEANKGTKHFSDRISQIDEALLNLSLERKQLKKKLEEEYCNIKSQYIESEGELVLTEAKDYVKFVKEYFQANDQKFNQKCVTRLKEIIEKYM